MAGGVALNYAADAMGEPDGIGGAAMKGLLAGGGAGLMAGGATMNPIIGGVTGVVVALTDVHFRIIDSNR